MQKVGRIGAFVSGFRVQFLRCLDGIVHVRYSVPEFPDCSSEAPPTLMHTPKQPHPFSTHQPHGGRSSLPAPAMRMVRAGQDACMHAICMVRACQDACMHAMRMLRGAWSRCMLAICIVRTGQDACMQCACYEVVKMHACMQYAWYEMFKMHACNIHGTSWSRCMHAMCMVRAGLSHKWFWSMSFHKHPHTLPS